MSNLIQTLLSIKSPYDSFIDKPELKNHGKIQPRLFGNNPTYCNITGENEEDFFRLTTGKLL